MASYSISVDFTQQTPVPDLGLVTTEQEFLPGSETR